MKNWDLENVYDAEIAPLMAKIIDICKAHKMPAFATFLYKHDPDGEDDGETLFCTTNLPFQGDRETPTEFNALLDAVRPSPRPHIRLTTRNKDGQVTDITEMFS